MTTIQHRAIAALFTAIGSALHTMNVPLDDVQGHSLDGEILNAMTDAGLSNEEGLVTALLEGFKRALGRTDFADELLDEVRSFLDDEAEDDDEDEDESPAPKGKTRGGNSDEDEGEDEDEDEGGDLLVGSVRPKPRSGRSLHPSMPVTPLQNRLSLYSQFFYAVQLKFGVSLAELRPDTLAKDIVSQTRAANTLRSWRQIIAQLEMDYMDVIDEDLELDLGANGQATGSIFLMLTRIIDALADQTDTYAYIKDDITDLDQEVWSWYNAVVKQAQ